MILCVCVSPITVFALISLRTGGTPVVIESLCYTGWTETDTEKDSLGIYIIIIKGAHALAWSLLDRSLVVNRYFFYCFMISF